VVRSLAAVVGAAAADGMPGVTDVEQAERLLVDGTLCPTGNRAGEGRQGEGLYSGKRHRAGVNTLVVADRWGRLLDASESTRGAMHDARSFCEAGLDQILAGRDVLGDLGFLAAGSTRRCASRPMASCQRLRRSTTGRTVRPARRSSARSRC
jgi:DDE superfamily endonuclease